MGALTGNLVTSSRVVTGSREGGLEEQTAMVFANVDAMFRDGGGSFANVTQVRRSSVTRPSARRCIARCWR